MKPEPTAVVDTVTKQLSCFTNLCGLDKVEIVVSNQSFSSDIRIKVNGKVDPITGHRQDDVLKVRIDEPTFHEFLTTLQVLKDQLHRNDFTSHVIEGLTDIKLGWCHE